jgi:bisanhydrobacterioruberin hydratase
MSPDHALDCSRAAGLRTRFFSLRLPDKPRPLVLAIKVFLSVLLVMFPVGMVLMLTDSMTNKWLWTTSVFLGVQFLLTLTFTVAVASLGRALLAAAALIALSIAIEFIGVTTGYPFGRYYYSYFLEPFVIGNVPLAISFAWFTLVVNSYFLVLFLSDASGGGLRTVVLTAALVLGLDLALEPFAAYVNRYWRWMDGAVPPQNFVAWVGLALVFGFVLSRLLVVRDRERAFGLAAIPALVLGLNLFQFVAINLVHGHWELTAAGLAVVACALFFSACRGLHAV